MGPASKSPSLISRIVCALICAGAVALLLAVTPTAMLLAGADPSPSTWRRLAAVGSVFCLLAATAGFWLGPDRILRVLEDEWQGRLWTSILIGVGLSALARLLWRFTR